MPICNIFQFDWTFDRGHKVNKVRVRVRVRVMLNLYACLRLMNDVHVAS